MLELKSFEINIARGTADPEIDSGSWIKFSHLDLIALKNVINIISGGTFHSSDWVFTGGIARRRPN